MRPCSDPPSDTQSRLKPHFDFRTDAADPPRECQTPVFTDERFASLPCEQLHECHPGEKKNCHLLQFQSQTPKMSEDRRKVSFSCFWCSQSFLLSSGGQIVAELLNILKSVSMTGNQSLIGYQLPHVIKGHVRTRDRFVTSERIRQETDSGLNSKFDLFLKVETFCSSFLVFSHYQTVRTFTCTVKSSYC